MFISEATKASVSPLESFLYSGERIIYPLSLSLINIAMIHAARTWFRSCLYNQYCKPFHKKVNCTSVDRTQSTCNKICVHWETLVPGELFKRLQIWKKKTTNRFDTLADIDKGVSKTRLILYSTPDVRSRQLTSYTRRPDSSLNPRPCLIQVYKVVRRRKMRLSRCSSSPSWWEMTRWLTLHLLVCTLCTVMIRFTKLSAEHDETTREQHSERRARLFLPRRWRRGIKIYSGGGMVSEPLRRSLITDPLPGKTWKSRKIKHSGRKNCRMKENMGIKGTWVRREDWWCSGVFILKPLIPSLPSFFILSLIFYPCSP